MDTYNYEMAQKFCQRALEIDNDNVRALETTATLLLEVIVLPNLYLGSLSGRNVLCDFNETHVSPELCYMEAI